MTPVAHTLRRGACAIVGVAESDLGEVAAGLSPLDLMAQAAHRALDDAGLSLRDVDGLFATTSQSRMPTLALSEYLGIRPRWTTPDDQKRLAAPGTAIGAGADYLVVGRPIIDAADPVLATTGILLEIEQALSALTEGR